MRCAVLITLLIGLLFFPSLAHAEEDTGGDVRAYLQALQGKDYYRALEAASKLGTFPQYRSEIIPALIQALKNEWDRCSGDVREAIAESLGKLKAREAVVSLLELIKSGKSLGHDCVQCGCCFHPLTPRDMLAERLDPDPFCEFAVLAAINQLADFSHSRMISALISEGKYRAELIMILGKVGPPRYAHFISRYKDDSDPYVRQAVATALGLMKNDEITIPVLVSLLGKPREDFSIKWEASNSLLRPGRNNEKVKKALLDLLDEADKETVLLASRSLALLQDKRGLETLKRLASDADPRLRLEAILYLGELADTSSKELFLESLKDENLSVRACALYALGRLGDKTLIPAMKEATRASLEYERELEARFDRSKPEEVKKLERYITHFSLDLRKTLAEALENIEGPKMR